MQLNDSLSLLILPFSLDLSNFKGLPDNSIWERSDISMIDNFFFRHVREYLTANLDKQKAIDPTYAIIYDLKDSFNQTTLDSASAAYVLLKKRHRIEIGNNENESIDFKFLLHKKKLTSPKLILFPLTSVGIITMGIELVGECSMNHQVMLNYKIEKYKLSNSTTVEILPSSQHTQEQQQIRECYSAINSTEPLHAPKCGNRWRFSQLNSILLNDLRHFSPQLSNSGRYHIFSYSQVDSKGDTTEVLLNFERMVRCQNSKYKPIMIDSNDNILIKQTFDNIYIGSCVEGAGMLVDTHENESLSIEQFKDQILISRYLWIYLLVYYQRISLMHITDSLLDFRAVGESSKDEMLALISKLSEITLRTKFADISDFTQHNIYHKFCMTNLGVYSYYAELNEKTNYISGIINEKVELDNRKVSLRQERLLNLLLIPQIVLAYVTIHVDLFGVKAYLSTTLSALYSNKTVSVVMFTLLTVLILPILTLMFILSKEFFKSLKRKK